MLDGVVFASNLLDGGTSGVTVEPDNNFEDGSAIVKLGEV